MQEKALFILGADYQFKNYFDIEYTTGSKVEFLDYLKEKSKTQEKIVLLADILDEKEFPQEEDQFWEYFTSEGKNRIFFILHNRSQRIEEAIHRKRIVSNISGPVFFQNRLKDGTELSEVENELILYVLYQIFPEIESNPKGVLSIRIFVPNEILNLTKLMNQVYEKYLEQASEHMIGTDFPVIKEELDLKEFRVVNMDYRPFDFELDETEIVEIDPIRIQKMIESTINDKNVSFVYEKISQIRDRVLSEKNEHMVSFVSLKGAGSTLNKLMQKEEEVKNRINYYKKNLVSIFDVLKQLRSEASEETISIANKFGQQVNDLLTKYQSLKTFIKYFFFKKNIMLLFVLSSAILSLLLYNGFTIIFSYSIPLSILFSSILSFLIWRLRKRKIQREILDVCDDGTQRILSVLNHYYKKIPQDIWERNLSLLNIKIGNIIYQYVKRSIESLKLIDQNKPIDILTDIFPSKQKMVFFMPSKGIKDSDLHFDDFDCYMNMDKDDLKDYFKRKYFDLAKNILFEIINKGAQYEKKYLKEFCDQPDLGLLWDVKEVVDFRESTLNKYFFKPKDFSIDSLENLSFSKVSDFISAGNGQLNVAVLMSFFRFKES